MENNNDIKNIVNKWYSENPHGHFICFKDNKIVALFSCTSHLTDIGGLGTGPDGTDVHMEGLYIPMLKLADRGVMNKTLLAMIRQNTRQPVETEGDVYSLAACNDIGCIRLVDMMEEFKIDDLNDLSNFIYDKSLKAVELELAKIPNGTFTNNMMVDGFESDVELNATISIFENSVVVDYSGTSKQSKYGWME